MLESLKTLVNAFKEGALEAGAKAYLNQKIERFGTVSDLRIDPRAKTILLEASLRGESSPVSVKMLDYELVSAADAAYLVFGRFEASREWIAGVLNEFVAGQRMALPPSVIKLL